MIAYNDSTVIQWFPKVYLYLNSNSCFWCDWSIKFSGSCPISGFSFNVRLFVHIVFVYKSIENSHLSGIFYFLFNIQILCERLNHTCQLPVSLCISDYKCECVHALMHCAYKGCRVCSSLPDNDKVFSL